MFSGVSSDAREIIISQEANSLLEEQPRAESIRIRAYIFAPIPANKIYCGAGVARMNMELLKEVERERLNIDGGAPLRT